MNTVGVFAGRGDVLVAMAFAIVIGVWVGWKIHQIVDWVRARVKKK